MGEHLRWKGNVPIDCVSVYYNLVDVVVNPAVRRPVDWLNVCVLYAMSCVKPAVGTSVAGSELVIEKGETGFITPEQDTVALAALVEKEGLRQNMGAAGNASGRNWSGRTSRGATWSTSGA